MVLEISVQCPERAEVKIKILNRWNVSMSDLRHLSHGKLSHGFRGENKPQVGMRMSKQTKIRRVMLDASRFGIIGLTSARN